MKSSDVRVLTVLGAIVLVSITMNGAISAYRFLNVEVSYMRSFTALGAIVLISISYNERNSFSL